MKAKDKANELGNKLYQGSVFDYDKEEHVGEKKKAKKRAHVCIDVFIDFLHRQTDKQTKLKGVTPLEYWEQVKEEVHNL